MRLQQPLHTIILTVGRAPIAITLSLFVVATMAVFASSLTTHAVQQDASDLNPPATWRSADTDDTYSIAWGDVDLDGDLDLAVGNFDTSNKLYFNNKGVLETTATWNSVETDQTASVRWGDVNGDGYLDLAVGNVGAPNRVYLNSNGSLETTATWKSNDEDETYSVDWGDIDGDGDLDLAAGNDSQPNKIYFNLGDELETDASQLLGDDEATRSVAWGDADRDGQLDLAVGNFGEPNTVYLNQGGELQQMPFWISEDNNDTFDVAWGELNGDSYPELAAGNTWPPNKVYLNDGGILQTGDDEPWESSYSDCTTSLAWGDMDGDGDLDLAGANNSTISGCGFTGIQDVVYINEDGALDGGEWHSQDFSSSTSIAWGDMDGDGDLDLAVGDSGGPNKVYLNEAVHVSSIDIGPPWSINADCPYSVAWGDVDGDRDLDLAVGNVICNETGANKLYINQNGALQSSAAWIADDSSSTNDQAWGDMDGDGDLDLAVGNDGPNRVYRNENGMLTPNSVWVSDETDMTQSVTWGDVDGDGDLDLATGNWFAANRLYRNENGRLSEAAVWQSQEVEESSDVAWGDVDGDGDLDLAVGNDGQANRVYFNVGGELEPVAGWHSGDGSHTTGVAWGDVDADGFQDLAFSNNGETNKVYLNKDGTLQTDADSPWHSSEDFGTSAVARADVDGDGDLDLTFVNWTDSDVLHWNHEGVLSSQATVMVSTQDGNSIAWADVDGDGDLDAAVAHEYIGLGGYLSAYMNLRGQWLSGWDSPVHIRLNRPGNTDDAAFYSSAETLRDGNVTIEYVLADPKEENVIRILPEYSPNGGGLWLSATPGQGGDGLTNLSTSASGSAHSFVWDAEADLIKNDNVAFRIRAIPGRNRSPIHWPAQAAHTFPFRVEAARWFAKVVDKNTQAVEGVLLYQGGERLTFDGLPATTDRAGLLRLNEPEADEPLVGLQEVWEQPTQRKAHDGWAYRVYITNLNLDENGVPYPDHIEANLREQRVTLQPENPLILFNIVVSIEWDADQAYVETIQRAFKHASDYLYDVTDGQMAFGQVHIFDNSDHWADADFQFSTKNTVVPYAFVGGIVSDDTAHAIRIGRFWDGDSGSQGQWDKPYGYRTLIHEFGHYALHLYDEYYVRTVDAAGHFTGQKSKFCTDLEIASSDDTPTNASIMYYQYKTSELADSDRWNDDCRETEQHRVNQGSDWTTVEVKYADKNAAPRWQLKTPADRGNVMAGPDTFPTHLLPFPEITPPSSSGTGGITREVHVQDPGGAAFPNVLVALYTTRKDITIAIDQGLTDIQGHLSVYGALAGDTIQVASLDGAFAGAAAVDDSLAYTIALEQTGPAALYAADSFSSPYLNLIPTSDGDSLFLEVHGAPQGSIPLNAVVIPGQGAGTPQSTSLAYSASKGAYTGAVSFAGVGLGSGDVRVNGTPGGQYVSINANYNLQWVGNDQSNELASEDGNLQLYLDPGSLEMGSAEAYATILPTGYVPAPLPDDKQVLASERLHGSLLGGNDPPYQGRTSQADLSPRRHRHN